MADYFLPRSQQIAAAIESVSGTAETLDAGDVRLKPFQSDAPFTPEYERFANDEVSPDIGEAPDFTGGWKARIAAGFNLQTGGLSGGVIQQPAIGIYLRACGMKEQIVRTITVGSISPGGSFAEGATFSATGGKTGIIEATRTGAGTLRYISTAGDPIASADVVTVGADSATATGTAAIYAYKYTPSGVTQESLTIQRGILNSEGTASHDSIFRLRGAMGNAVLTFTPSDVVRFAGNFLGVDDEATEDALLAGYTYETENRPRFRNATIQLNGVDVKVNTVTFDTGNDLQMDPDPSTDGGDAGYLAAYIAKRTPTIAVAPLRTVASVLDDIGIHRDGTEVAFQLLLNAESAGTIVELVVPKVQVRTWGIEDRGGKQASPMTLNVTRAALTDLDYAIYFR